MQKFFPEVFDCFIGLNNLIFKLTVWMQICYIIFPSLAIYFFMSLNTQIQKFLDRISCELHIVDDLNRRKAKQMFFLKVLRFKRWFFFFKFKVIWYFGKDIMTERITILYLFLLRVANLGLYSQKLGDQMIFIVRSCWQILYSQSKIRCTYQIFINRIIFFASVIVEKFHKNTPD